MENQPIGSHVVDVKAVANEGDTITYSIITDELCTTCDQG